jgi:hypothetical protein
VLGFFYGWELRSLSLNVTSFLPQCNVRNLPFEHLYGIISIKSNYNQSQQAIRNA